MTSVTKIAFLAAVGTALLAGSASAQTYHHHARHVAAPSGLYAPAQIPGGQVYLLENRGPGTRNTNAAENFQDQFNVDY